MAELAKKDPISTNAIAYRAVAPGAKSVPDLKEAVMEHVSKFKVELCYFFTKIYGREIICNQFFSPCREKVG